MENDLKNQIDIAFKIINQVALAKKAVNDAFVLARKNSINQAKEKLELAKKELGNGHKLHGDLIQKEAAGQELNVSLLLVHAEDQMMTTESMIMLATEMISMYQKINALEEAKK